MCLVGKKKKHDQRMKAGDIQCEHSCLVGGSEGVLITEVTNVSGCVLLTKLSRSGLVSCDKGVHFCVWRRIGHGETQSRVH